MTGGRAIVLNGTSSAGKTSLGRALQDRLGGWWLLLGIDTLITTMPRRMFGTADGHTINADGSIVVGPGWRLAHDHWRASVGELVRAGTNVIVDEVFPEGAADQARWRRTFSGVPVIWVGVQCDVEVAAARETARADRVPHLARSQSRLVHEGVDYDIVVDTTTMSADDVADVVIAQLPSHRAVLRPDDARLQSLHHVQLAMPSGGEAAARSFYRDLLGLPEKPKPPELARRGGCWFESETVKIHLGVETDFRPAKKAHPALLVLDLSTLVRKMVAAGVEVVDDEPLEGYDRVYAYDPFGNRLELLEQRTH